MFEILKYRAMRLHKFKDFLFLSVRKEFKSRYTESALGTLWIMFEPMILVATMSIIFTLLGRHGPEGIAFPVFFYSGILPWNLFATCLTRGTQVFISDRALISKVNFPKEISVFKNQSVFLLDFLFASLTFVVILIIFHVTPNLFYLYLPALIFLQVLLGIGVMFVTATLNVFIRDVGILTRNLATVWFWFTPIIFDYPFSGNTKIIYYLNPMAGIVDGYRKIIIYNQAPIFETLWCALIASPILILIGYVLFIKKEGHFADAL